MAEVIDTLLVQLGFKGVGSEVPKQHDAENKKAVDNVEKQEKRRTAVRRKGRKDREKIINEEKKDKDKEVIDDEKNLEEEEEKEKESTKRRKRANLFFKSLTLARVAVTAYASKKLLDFAKSGIKSSAALEVMSESLADTPETLNAWSNALEQLSGNGEDAVSTIANLQSQINEFNTLGTNPEFIQQLSLLGISPNVKKGSDILDQLHEAIKKSPYSKTETATRMAGIGISPEMFALLSRENYAERMTTARERARNANAGSKASQQTMEDFRGITLDIEKGIKNFGVDWLNHMSEASKKRLFQDEKKYDSEIDLNSKKYGVPKELIQGLISNESAFNSSAKSSVGAKGIMQLMPETEKQYGGGIEGGTHFIADLYKQYGSWDKAVAAYNSNGQNTKFEGDNWISKMPSKTQRFVPAVLGYAQDFQKHNAETGGNTTTTVTVNELNVNTQATDAVGISQTIKSCLTAQCENGMQ